MLRRRLASGRTDGLPQARRPPFSRAEPPAPGRRWFGSLSNSCAPAVRPASEKGGGGGESGERKGKEEREGPHLDSVFETRRRPRVPTPEPHAACPRAPWPSREPETRTGWLGPAGQRAGALSSDAEDAAHVFAEGGGGLRGVEAADGGDAGGHLGHVARVAEVAAAAAQGGREGVGGVGAHEEAGGVGVEHHLRRGWVGWGRIRDGGGAP